MGIHVSYNPRKLKEMLCCRLFHSVDHNDETDKVEIVKSEEDTQGDSPSSQQ